MAVIYQLTLRNIRLFVRDRMAFFFSMLNPIIIIGLYLLFIRTLNLSTLSATLNEMQIEYTAKSLNFFMDSWMITGVISVTSMTLPLGIFSLIVEDRSKNIDKDFIASPVKSYKVILSYILAVLIISVTTLIIILAALLVYLYASTGYFIGLLEVFSILAVVVLSCLCSSFMFVILAYLINSMSAFSGLNALLGVALGFLTGSYMPLSIFPMAMQTAAAFLPATHVAAVLRNIFMQTSLPALLKNADTAAYSSMAESLKDSFGANLNLFNWSVPLPAMVIFIAAATVIFFITALFVLKKRA